MKTQDIQLQFNYDSAEIEDIRRCLTMLYSTREGEQPLDRSFGLNTQAVSAPLPVAQNQLTLEIVRKTAMYERRVKVSRVTYEFDTSKGITIPTVHLIRGDE